ncbi:nSTAND1 domain-containing NTPase [Endothiovibrio diazotrophicus]
MTTIYLSSTYEDLKEHRAAVFDALRRSGYQVIAMEDDVARDDRPLRACLADVERADLYVGLFAFRYGYIPPVEHGNPQGRSITELEFRHADAAPNTRCLLFLLDEQAPWPSGFNDSWTGEGEQGERIRRLREELARDKMASFFSSPHELASQVQAAVSRYLASRAPPAGQPVEPVEAVTWDVAERGSPYPGLMRFTRRYAPVFFGREVEVRELLDRLSLPEGRFVIVSGDSGSGKSSLVEAGVLPRLEEGERSLRGVRMVPSGGEDPFDALLRALHPRAERAGLDGYRLGRELAAGRAEPVEVLGKILGRGAEREALLLFVDQMEELFTAERRDAPLIGRFLAALHEASQTLPLRILATIRGDLLHHCYAYPEMLAVLRGPGHYPLGRAAPHMLHEMIVRPARCAGIRVPEALARRLTEEVGPEPGNLPLLAFVLERLFERRTDDGLSEAAYRAMGGLVGAIAEHVKEVERALAKALELDPERLEARLAGLFEGLVQMDTEGLPTRRRVRRTDLPEPQAPVVEALIQARLLAVEGEGAECALSVAHERLFQAWPALARWVDEHQEALRLLRQGKLDAAEWQRQGRDLVYLWHTDRLRRLQTAIEDLPEARAGAELRAFAWPQPLLVRLLDDPQLDHESRDSIGRRLAALGDFRPGVGVGEEGTPEVDWVEIPGGEVELEGGAGKASVAPFRISRYLVTNAQFQAFVDAADGYAKAEWWREMPEEARNGPGKPSWSEPNRPRESVSWYEAVAFCRWLSRRLGFEVRLPTEYEWQQAATGGDPKNAYPWGGEWDARCCNTSESGLNRTVAVGLYPAGATTRGVLDMAGNVWEWCLNKRGKKPGEVTVDGSGESRVLRGGSWIAIQVNARAGFPFSYRPDGRIDSIGFRVVFASFIR